MNKTVWIMYTNHRGVTAWRQIVPLSIIFGLSEWHPGEQWLMNAEDVEKQAVRTFAMKDILSWRDTKPSVAEGTVIYQSGDRPVLSRENS